MSRQEVRTLRVITEDIQNSAGGTPTISGLSVAELERLDGVTAGTVTASKAVVVDANKDIGDFRNLDAVNIDAGASGTAGTVDVFPTTAARGKLIIAAVANDGATNVTISNAAMGQASVVSIPDPGAATANFLLTDQANDQSLVTATAAELNYNDITTLGTGAASKAVVLDAGGDFIMPAAGLFGLSRGTLAALGSTAADAAVITEQVTAVTASNGTLAVALPAAAVTIGPLLVINTVATAGATLPVFPVNGGNDNINGLAEDAAFTMLPGEACWFIPTSATQWYVARINLLTLGTTSIAGNVILSDGANPANYATLLTDAQSANIALHCPDPGAIVDAYVALSTAALTAAEVDVLDGATAGTQVASKAVVADANVNTGISKVTELHIGASGSETQVTATGAELNYNDITTLGTLAASKTWTSDASLDTIMPTGGLLTVQSGGAVTMDSGSTLTVNGTTATTAAAAEHGAGAIGTAAVPATRRWTDRGVIITRTTIDLTGLASVNTANDVIGLAAGGAAYIGRNVEATNGVIFKTEWSCLETPAGGDDDINVVANASAVLAYDGAGGTTYVAGDVGNLLKGQTSQSLVPVLTEGDYFYLTAGTGDTAAAYTAGMYVLTTYGHAVLV